MTMALAILILAALSLAWSNGANDNFKGVATLYGSATTSYRGALRWATSATVAGSVVSIWFAQGLLRAFSGKGLVPDALVAAPELQLAVGGAAALTILLATRLGMPTSTTHALTGGLMGAALAANASINWQALGKGFAAPLLISPLVAIALAVVLYHLQRAVGRACGITRQTCLCVGNESPQPVAIQSDGTAVLMSTGVTISVDDVANCMLRYQGAVAGVEAQTALTGLHYLSGGAVCFSRALNDTPKIAALLLVAQTVLPPAGALGLIATAMAAGGWLQSRRVAVTMSKRITTLTPGQGLSANLTTALLVLVASRWGLPVSTTHVSCGSIFGIGLANRTGDARTIMGILTAWLTTLPFAGVLAAMIYVAVSRVSP